jgi:predicted DNA-binding transcriptional regulator AlpA
MPERPWSAKQVAECLGLSEETVRKGRAGTWEIPRIKMGRATRWLPDDVREWQARQRQKSVGRIEQRRNGQRLRKAS